MLHATDKMLCTLIKTILYPSNHHIVAQVSADKLIKDRLVAKNAVEEYVYEMRDKLYGRYEKYLSESDREEYMATLSGTENWLYEEGENCQKQVHKLVHTCTQTCTQTSQIVKTGIPGPLHQFWMLILNQLSIPFGTALVMSLNFSTVSYFITVRGQ